MFGVILFLNSRGDIILSRAFRDNFNIRLIADTFCNDILAMKKAERCPIHIIDKMCYLHLRYESLYVLMCTSVNANCMMAYQYMIRLISILVSYFGSIDEHTLKSNFVTVQELIDETMDFGYPQQTELNVLKSYINAEGSKGEVLKRKKESEQITIKATGKIPWRREGIVYSTNEVFLDVAEEVNILISQTGQVLQREVTGAIVMKAFLSGMPECQLCFNDKMLSEKAKKESKTTESAQIELDDVTFHSCVRMGQFDSDRSICFTPPDGECVLMRYRSSANVNPPLKIMSSRVKELARTRVEIDLRLKSEFPAKVYATDVALLIPCPANTATVKVRVAQGKAKYDSSQQAVVWKIRKLQGGAEVPFSCEISLIAATLQSTERAWSRPPISIKFQIQMFQASGLQIEYLKVLERKLGYDANKWVKYRTTGGQYQCRI